MRLQAPPVAGASSVAAEEARVTAYWTPERMRATPPLDPPDRTADPLASASFVPVSSGSVARAGGRANSDPMLARTAFGP